MPCYMGSYANGSNTAQALREQCWLSPDGGKVKLVSILMTTTAGFSRTAEAQGSELTTKGPVDFLQD